MDWDNELAAAFGILLGTPLADHDVEAAYAAYYAGEVLNELAPPAEWLSPAALADPAPTALPDPVYLDEDHQDLAWRFDLNASFLRFTGHLLDGDRFPAGFTADVRAAAVEDDGDHLIRGGDLAPLLTRHGVDLTGDGAENLKHELAPVLRIATDGTLFDALRAATFTHLGPGRLLPMGGADGYAEKAESPWEEALGAVRNEALRDHLRFHCLSGYDARSCGALYLAADEWPPLYAELPHEELVAGWGFGEDQHGVVVVRLP